MTLERRYRDKKAVGRRQERERPTGGFEAAEEDGRVRNIKRQAPGEEVEEGSSRTGRSVQAESSDRPVCLVVRKLMDALKDTHEALLHDVRL